jgi:tetratricopeptide (TPR) repeat protein
MLTPVRYALAIFVALVCVRPAPVVSAEPRAAEPLKRDLLTQAEILLDAAALTQNAAERFRLADEAVKLCERSGKEHPEESEAVYKLVRALTVADPDHPELCRPNRCEAALSALDGLAKRDRLGIEAGRIAAEQGIVLSRLQRYPEALAAYERALPLVVPARSPTSLEERGDMALLWCNSAETSMAVGRLEDAVRRYELTLDYATYRAPDWQLALYGLGVALDRDGQVERAKLTIARVLERDPALARLHDESVFFEPPGDVHYYEGLAHEVAGDDLRALRAFNEYLAAQPRSRYAARAKVHVAMLSRRLARAPRKEQKAGVVVGSPIVDHTRRDVGAVQAYAQSHEDEMRVCYERYLREHPASPLNMSLALLISPFGFAHAQVLTTTEPALQLSRCIELSVDSWRFPPLTPTEGEPEQMLLPIELTPPTS